MTPKPTHSLILATDPVLATLVETLERILLDLGQRVRPTLWSPGIGDVLRQLHLSPPDAVFVCISPRYAEPGSAVIEAVRRRRPQMPLLAVAEHHDPHLERSVRSAGATYYFPLEAAQDEQQLRRALQMLGMARPAAPPGVPRAPPRRPAVPRRSRARDGPRRTYQT